MTSRCFVLASLALLGLATASCSLKSFEQAPAASVANQCAADTDCAAGERCAGGACYAAVGKIDDAVFEIVPDVSSPLGGLSFLSSQSGLAHGDGARNITLTAPKLFRIQVRALASDLDLLNPSSACAYVGVGGWASIHALVEFDRTGQIAGIPIAGMPAVSETYETQRTATGAGAWATDASLVEGSYDIYVQPRDVAGCPPVAPYLWRNVSVGPNVDVSTAPATLDLPAASALKGTVTRPSGSLVGWSVDLVEPITGRIISTSTTLGETSPEKSQTNFELTYHLVSAVAVPPSTPATVSAANTTSPLIRIAPSKDIVGPTVFWDLAAADLNGDGVVSLDMSGVPTPDAARLVRGRVQGTSSNTEVGVPATVVLLSTALDGTTGLTASWGRSIHTDSDGYFFLEVFSGDYRVIAVPDASLDPSASWAITETRWSVHFDPTVSALSPQTIDVNRQTTVTGRATVAKTGEPAIGATLEAVPSSPNTSTGVLSAALAEIQVTAQSQTVSVATDGSFSMLLDPGDFDLFLRPPDGSGFAWWVQPSVHVDASAPLDLSPTLGSPIAVEGTLRGTLGDSTTVFMANAVVRAYAKAPGGLGVAKVGSTRTDAAGKYRLLLPVDFGP
jgi:hypothetical protein